MAGSNEEKTEGRKSRWTVPLICGKMGDIKDTKINIWNFVGFSVFVESFQYLKNVKIFQFLTLPDLQSNDSTKLRYVFLITK